MNPHTSVARSLANTLYELKQDKVELLSKRFPTIAAASAEIINLNSILNLPKATEHYMSDVHGEYESFIHMLRNCSGVIRIKAQETFKDLSEPELKELATLIYYPDEKLPLLIEKATDKKAFYRTTIGRVITMCRVMARKYTRSHVRKALPAAFAYSIEELLHEQAYEKTNTASNYNRSEYFNAIVEGIIDTDVAADFIVACCHLIKRLAVERLHIIGDIWDRGPGAEIIMDTLCRHHSVDVQWGNHDIVWMGAAAGSDVCMVNNIRIALRYSNMKTLEEGYAISMLPLVTFANEVYKDDPCTAFMPKPSEEVFTPKERELIGKMHKAMAIIQAKLEGQIYRRHPEWNMQDRMLLDMINFQDWTIKLPDGSVHPLNDKFMPTINPADPNALTPEEKSVVDRLRLSHLRSERLQRHAKFMFDQGSSYLVNNNMLLFHACVPLTAEGLIKETTFTGERLKGRALFDKIEAICRQGFYYPEGPVKQNGVDMMWYLWVGADSPLFGKDKMTTFERYFIDDKATWKETGNPYYKLRDTAACAARVLTEFGIDPSKGVILNGHTPVKVVKGETPIKADGKCVVIDGGFSKAYQKETGIAGYTLISNSVGVALASHKPFVGLNKAIFDNEDMYSDSTYLSGMYVTGPKASDRTYIRQTDLGKKIQIQIDQLNELINAYACGILAEGSAASEPLGLLPSEWIPPQ